MRRTLIAYLLAGLVTYLLGSLLATQVTLADLRQLGIPLTLRDHLLTSLRDIAGLALSYFPVLLLVLAPAFAAAGLLGALVPRLRGVLYPLLAAAAVLGLHLSGRELLGFSLLAATRHDHGLSLQGLAGWCGGYACFMFLGLARR